MRRRDRIDERMDDPRLDRDAHFGALRGLGRINALSRSVARLWGPIAAACAAAGDRPVCLLDLACGGGDVTRGIARRARRAGLRLEVHGADLSPVAVAFAEESARHEGLDVGFRVLDALHDPIPAGFDVILSTLFLHHLDDDDAAALLGKMAAAAGRLVLIDDLIRGRAGYALAWAGCRLLSRSPVVHHDGPVSVRGAFRVDEIRRMADAAGLVGATIETHWPARFLLSWSRP